MATCQGYYDETEGSSSDQQQEQEYQDFSSLLTSWPKIHQWQREVSFMDCFPRHEADYSLMTDIRIMEKTILKMIESIARRLDAGVDSEKICWFSSIYTERAIRNRLILKMISHVISFTHHCIETEEMCYDPRFQRLVEHLVIEELDCLFISSGLIDHCRLLVLRLLRLTQDIEQWTQDVAKNREPYFYDPIDDLVKTAEESEKPRKVPALDTVLEVISRRVQLAEQDNETPGRPLLVKVESLEKTSMGSLSLAKKFESFACSVYALLWKVNCGEVLTLFNEHIYYVLETKEQEKGFRFRDKLRELVLKPNVDIAWANAETIRTRRSFTYSLKRSACLPPSLWLYLQEQENQALEANNVTAVPSPHSDSVTADTGHQSDTQTTTADAGHHSNTQTTTADAGHHSNTQTTPAAIGTKDTNTTETMSPENIKQFSGEKKVTLPSLNTASYNPKNESHEKDRASENSPSQTAGGKKRKKRKGKKKGKKSSSENTPDSPAGETHWFENPLYSFSEEKGSAETGSAETGSAETGSAETVSAETASAETASAETGSAPKSNVTQQEPLKYVVYDREKFIHSEELIGEISEDEENEDQLLQDDIVSDKLVKLVRRQILKMEVSKRFQDLATKQLFRGIIANRVKAFVREDNVCIPELRQPVYALDIGPQYEMESEEDEIPPVLADDRDDQESLEGMPRIYHDFVFDDVVADDVKVKYACSLLTFLPLLPDLQMLRSRHDYFSDVWDNSAVYRFVKMK